MFGFTVLDVVLLLWLFGQLVYGLRVGLVASLGGLAGFAAGAAAAFLAVPFISPLAGDSGWRTALVIGSTVLFIVVGHGVGIRLGSLLGRGVRFQPVRAVNRLLGGVLNVLVGALVLSLLAFGVGNLGVPFLSTALADSQVIRNIDKFTPDPVKAAAAQLRSLVLDEGIPQILGQQNAPVLAAPPDSSVNTEALNSASGAVVKITGAAFQCGQNQTGSGFVVSADRVVTNAHVVAGVDAPVVELRGGRSVPGRVVFFDPQKDLAVVAVDSLGVAPLPLGPELVPGAGAAFAGYPLGGPFQMRPAAVASVGPLMVPDIYGANPAPAQVYQLAGNVQPGNSGGPMFDTAGNVVGVIFAKATSADNVGFAFTMDELGPVAAAAPALSNQVSSGHCTAK
ncbi:MarP family serine protease [Arthrobacter sp. 35W]|uniref:MarP family serine protease n=1 Tax=Arthrobacter sp. 35W TaxID=1132441 RepID=UPI00047EDDB5|nr:MarP family serine protease [Arthrobacter sp. 35W]